MRHLLSFVLSPLIITGKISHHLTTFHRPSPFPRSHTPTLGYMSPSILSIHNVRCNRNAKIAKKEYRILERLERFDFKCYNHHLYYY